MKGAHLSAEELQQYAEDKLQCTPEDIAHLEGCPDCRAEVAAYTLLMKELKAQPAPVFGFDVSAMVLEKLAESPVAERGILRRADRRTGLGMAALIVLVTAVPAWLFRRSAYYMFTDIPASFLYLILGVAGLFMLLRILLLLKRYQHIINSIK